MNFVFTLLSGELCIHPVVWCVYLVQDVNNLIYFYSISRSFGCVVRSFRKHTCEDLYDNEMELFGRYICISLHVRSYMSCHCI